jgi:uncharacterized phage-associated protein
MPILVDERRTKLIEAIVFFVANTKHCGMLKLFKLLYYLDYHHFRETGRDVTGLAYYAYPYGPVPKELHEQFKNKAGDIADQFVINENTQISDEYEIPTIDNEPNGAWSPNRRYVPSRIKPKKRFTKKHLTVRELRIAEHLAEIFKEATADQMSDVSHQKGGPWSLALKNRGERALIDFMSTLVPMHDGNYLSEEGLIEQVKENEELHKALS